REKRMMMKQKMTRKGLILGLIFSMTMGGLSALARGESPEVPETPEAVGFAGPEIVSLTLDNGIPLIVQQSETSSVRSLKLFFEGHAQYTVPSKEGIEKMTLTLMSHGSENYSWEEVQTLLHEKSSSVGASADYFDYSGFSLTTLDKYYEEIYDLFSDELLNPSWDEEEFDKVKNSLLMARTQKEADPYSLASQVLSDSFFGDHAYQADIDGNLESLESITLDDLKAYYEMALTADRMFFVAVGDFDVQALREELNKDFGSLSFTGESFTPVSALESVEEGLLTEHFASSPDLAYVRGNWSLPEMSEADEAALDLALSLLDDILFQVVRTENSACYSVWANLYDFQAKYACFGVFKTQVPYDVDEMILQAVDILASGLAMSTSPGGDDPYVPIAESLDFYKAQFVTKYYSGQQTSASIAEQIGKSYLYDGDPAAYRLQSTLWENVTAEDIVRVVEEYIEDQPILWIVLGGDEVL
ncbi:MAG: pitrilysin family protein, partial [Spirochaetales bacterium]|nr:pitrilysin family protein [Spirochaetales bacterium]